MFINVVIDVVADLFRSIVVLVTLCLDLLVVEPSHEFIFVELVFFSCLLVSRVLDEALHLFIVGIFICSDICNEVNGALFDCCIREQCWAAIVL